MRRPFGLVGQGGKAYQWQSVVPMGWSWSPLLAQRCAWTVLSYSEEGEAPYWTPLAFHQGRLSSWVGVLSAKGEKIGVCTVHSDNYLSLLNDANGIDRVNGRLERNMIRYSG